MPRRGDYLFRKKGSQNWYLKLQYPPALAEEEGTTMRRISLGTPDRKEAEILAAPMILEHKRLLYLYNMGKRLRHAPGIFTIDDLQRAAARHIVDNGGGLKRLVTPYTTVEHPDGARSVATETEVHHIGADGTLIKTVENERLIVIPPEAFAPSDARDLARAVEQVRAIKQADDPDRQMIETWIRQQNISAHLQREAWAVFDQFKAMTRGKSFAKATRQDGRNLAQHYFDAGNKTATVAKKIGHLRAAINIAIDDGILKFNAFNGVVPDLDDAKKRLPLSEDDMQIVAAHFHEFDNEEQLLWVLCATTGMRPGEPFQIHEEFADDYGNRYVIIGTKSEQSERHVPFPAPVLPYLPAKIDGSLFSGDNSMKNIHRSINRKLRRWGITDERKVLYSLRHRAKDRLREAECPEEMQYAILGHEKKTVAAGYGLGYSMRLKLRWIDEIGCPLP